MSTRILLLIFLFGSINTNCSEVNRDTESTYADSNKTLIELNSEMKFHWNNATSKIIQDQIWDSSKNAYENNKLALIKMVSNKEVTNAKVCGVNDTITKGQMAFIVLDQLEAIPYALVFQTQYCVINPGCPYIGGLIMSIKNNSEASNQLMDYFYNSEKSED